MAKKKNTVPASLISGKALAGRPTTGAAPTISTASGGTKTPAHDQIAKRAYEIWIAKGRPAGRDLENWQQAERELGVRR